MRSEGTEQRGARSSVTCMIEEWTECEGSRA